MTHFKSPHILFLIAMFFGSLLALTADNWISIYAGIELNLFAFLPLMAQQITNPEYEAIIKYLLAQILGSILLISGGVTITISPLAPIFPIIILLGLIIKIGAAPTHFWFPNVMAGLSWPLCFLLSTWQKLFPLLFFFNTLSPPHSTPLIILLAFGAILTAIRGLNQTSLRGILAYSSITHINWILCASLLSPLCAIIYFIIYILTTLIIISSFASSALTSTKIISLTTLSPPQKTILSLSFLSLAGLPPFLGFLPKWQVLDSLATSTPWIIPPLLLASITALFFYLKIAFFTLLAPSWSPRPLLTFSPYLPFSLILLNLILILSLFSF